MRPGSARSRLTRRSPTGAGLHWHLGDPCYGREPVGVMVLIGLLSLLAPAAIFFGIAALFGWQAAVAALLTPFALLVLFGLSRGIR